jgi:hypothetical protein
VSFRHAQASLVRCRVPVDCTRDYFRQKRGFARCGAHGWILIDLVRVVAVWALDVGLNVCTPERRSVLGVVESMHPMIMPFGYLWRCCGQSLWMLFVRRI